MYVIGWLIFAKTYCFKSRTIHTFYTVTPQAGLDFLTVMCNILMREVNQIGAYQSLDVTNNIF